jgi:hypothetical protein
MTARVPEQHAGGVLGGMSTGQPVVARVAFKPTSSILTPRESVNEAGEEIDLRTKGRHDPCVGIRGVPVVEAMTACVLADAFLRHRGQTGGGAFVPGMDGRRSVLSPLLEGREDLTLPLPRLRPFLGPHDHGRAQERRADSVVVLHVKIAADDLKQLAAADLGGARRASDSRAPELRA